jgi:zinc protease
LIDKYFGPIPASATPAPPTPRAASLQGEVRIEVAARVERPLVSFAWHAPPWFADGDADMAVISKLLAGTANALVLWKVGDDLKIASRATADHVQRQWGSMMDVRVTLAPGHEPQEVITAVGEVLDQLRSQAVSEEQIERAKGERLLTYAMSLERASARVEWYSTWRQLTGKADFSDADFERFSAVTPQSVRSSSSQWLNRNRVVTVVLPTPGAPVCGAVARVTRSSSP